MLLVAKQRPKERPAKDPRGSSTGISYIPKGVSRVCREDLELLRTASFEQHDPRRDDEWNHGPAMCSHHVSTAFGYQLGTPAANSRWW